MAGTSEVPICPKTKSEMASSGNDDNSPLVFSAITNFVRIDLTALSHTPFQSSCFSCALPAAVIHFQAPTNADLNFLRAFHRIHTLIFIGKRTFISIAFLSPCSFVFGSATSLSWISTSTYYQVYKIPTCYTL